MKLVLDVGNTRIKWRMGSASGETVHVRGGWEAQLLGAWRALPEPDALVVGSVASEALNQALEDCVRRIWPRVERVWLRSRAAWCGVRIQYVEPARFGVDRFAGLVAAHTEFPERALAVVDVGTAVTVDMLDATGVHRGGVIMPGVRLLQSSLASGAAKLAGSQRPASLRLCEPQNETCLAMAAGVCCMLQGGVLKALEQGVSVTGGSRAEVILCGGDAAYLDEAMFTQQGWMVHRRATLVLDGLERMFECMGKGGVALVNELS